MKLLLLLVTSIGLVLSLLEPCNIEKDKKCGGGGGGGGPPPPPSGVCNKNCFLATSSCYGPCPYCKQITATNWQCRADTCSMACLSSSECKGSCPVCFAAKCQQCQSDSHCQAAFGSAKPYCKRITATNRECRADTCSMACLSSSECKGSCPVCFAAKCQECQSDSHCPSSKPYCKRITVTNRECRADTCSMFCTSSSECKGSCSRCRWLKCQSGGSGGCFPGESQVMLEGGDGKRMEDLRVGDNILTVENGNLVTTQVLGFLDKRINHTTDYLSLILECNMRMFISRTHVMFIQGRDNTPKSIQAKDANYGDLVFIKDGKKVKLSKIIDITVEQKTGAYVPLTAAGTLLVDGVLVSCYTNTDHWLAHAALAPLRWWPSLLLDTEKTQDMEGLRTIPGLVRSLGRILGLVPQDQFELNVKASGPIAPGEIGMQIPKIGSVNIDKSEF